MKALKTAAGISPAFQRTSRGYHNRHLVPSETMAGVYYVVAQRNRSKRWTCDCPHWLYRLNSDGEDCKHIAAVKQKFLAVSIVPTAGINQEVHMSKVGIDPHIVQTYAHQRLEEIGQMVARLHSRSATVVKSSPSPVGQGKKKRKRGTPKPNVELLKELLGTDKAKATLEALGFKEQPVEKKKTKEAPAVETVAADVQQQVLDAIKSLRESVGAGPQDQPHAEPVRVLRPELTPETMEAVKGAKAGETVLVPVEVKPNTEPKQGTLFPAEVTVNPYRVPKAKSKKGSKTLLQKLRDGFGR